MGEISQEILNAENEKEIIKIMTRTDEQHILKFVSRQEISDEVYRQAILQYASRLSW